MKDWVRSGVVVFGVVVMVLLLNGVIGLVMVDEGDVLFQMYYGIVVSVFSYGGYGGNVNKKDSVEYIFDVFQVIFLLF